LQNVIKGGKMIADKHFATPPLKNRRKWLKKEGGGAGEKKVGRQTQKRAKNSPQVGRLGCKNPKKGQFKALKWGAVPK